MFFDIICEKQDISVPIDIIPVKGVKYSYASIFDIEKDQKSTTIVNHMKHQTSRNLVYIVFWVEPKINIFSINIINNAEIFMYLKSFVSNVINNIVFMLQ